MFIKVNSKNLVFGMNWHVNISDGSISKAVRSKKSTWYWHSGVAFNYGTIPREEKVVKKDLPLYSAAIAFSAAHVEGNVLAVITIPGTELFAICCSYQGRPRDGFDLVASSPNEVAKVISDFVEQCAESSYTMMGDVPYADIIPFTIHQLADSVTEYAQIKKVKSELINPVTILLALVVIGFGVQMAWTEYVKYRRAEVARKMAATQKSAQQQYDEALALKRKEPAMLASAAPQVLAAILKLPPQVGGWNMQRASCKPSEGKILKCTLNYGRGAAFPINNKSFLSESMPLLFKTITYKEDLKSIDAVWMVPDMPFVTVGDVIDASLLPKDELLEFGSHLQKLIPFGSPSITRFAPIVLAVNVDQSKLINKPTQFAVWKPQGPVRILELFSAFPKYAKVDEFNFSFAKAPRYRFNESFATVALTGTVYAKPN